MACGSVVDEEASVAWDLEGSGVGHRGRDCFHCYLSARKVSLKYRMLEANPEPSALVSLHLASR